MREVSLHGKSPGMRAEDILSLVELAPELRDAAAERALGLDDGARFSSESPGPELIGFHSSALSVVARVVLEVGLTPADVFVDLGAGRGKVVALVEALTGARGRGIELQRELVSSPARGVMLELGDARSTPLDDGTVFFLYAPFIGTALGEVLMRLHAVARRHAIVVCALGVTLPACDWLVPRELDAFWLTLFDSVVPGVAPRARSASNLPRDERLERLAHERR